MTVTNHALLLAAMLFSANAMADLVNGNFENGLTGWTATNEGSAAAIQTAIGTTTTSAGTIAPSPTANRYVYTSQTGPGRSILTQPFVVQGGVNKVFFDLAINNNASYYNLTPDSIEYSGAPNQQARFEILKPGASRTTVDPADIIVSAFQTHPGDASVQNWKTYAVDVTAQLAPYAGQTVLFRFVQVDNQSFMNLAIDNVNVGVAQQAGAAAVPAFGTAGLVLSSLLVGLFGLIRTRRSHK